ncbi:hypothetical protein [Rubrobacter tropicus]|uniref:hypothetical protein n=1 Tax=Rubrobacter tropicus TaxID=2653851 RepID=UPI00140E2A4A|nr:hypothetical protein [Rubrobacter tropicus]
MRFGGGGWRPDNRRNRRRNGGTGRSTEQRADRTVIAVLVIFTVLVLGLMIALLALSS